MMTRPWREKRGEVEPENWSTNLIVQLHSHRRPQSTLDERNLGQVVTVGSAIGGIEATGAIFEAEFMLPWTFWEEAAREKLMAQLQTVSIRRPQQLFAGRCGAAGVTPQPPGMWPARLGMRMKAALRSGRASHRRHLCGTVRPASQPQLLRKLTSIRLWFL
jgi:hypothetical protein